MQTTETQQKVPYSLFVDSLCKPGIDILVQMQPAEAHLVHMAMGVSGEAGELLDAIKKAAIYRKPLDRENVLEECGDLLFYIQGVLNYYSISMEEVIELNRSKLQKRYSEGKYTNAQANNRADKQEN
jgi:NTP pyrophosphatase (non-canonical NTP hydrolase)